MSESEFDLCHHPFSASRTNSPAVNGVSFQQNFSLWNSHLFEPFPGRCEPYCQGRAVLRKPVVCIHRSLIKKVWKSVIGSNSFVRNGNGQSSSTSNGGGADVRSNYKWWTNAT